MTSSPIIPEEGGRIFPSLVPITPDNPASNANREARKVLSRFEKPFAAMFSDGDSITRGSEKIFQKLVSAAKDQRHIIIKGGAHFLRESRGEEFTRAVVDFISRTH